MELRQLRYLVAISNEKNINRAAKLCFVSQPALTQQIHKLEEEFNTSLLIRRGRGITLSEDGEKLTRHAKKLIKKIDEIKQEFSKTDKNNINQIVLGIVPTLYEHYQLIVESKPADVSIELRKMGTDQLEYELRRGIISAAISPVLPKIKNTKNKLVTQEKIALIASKSHHLNCKDIIDLQSVQNEPVVMLDEKQLPRKYFDDYCQKNNLSIKVLLNVKTLEELIDVIENSKFISFVPNGLFSKEVEKKFFKTTLSDDLSRDYYLYWNQSESGTEKILFLEKYFQKTCC